MTPLTAQEVPTQIGASISQSDAEAMPSQMAAEMRVSKTQEMACPEVAGISQSDAEAMPSQMAGETANSQEMVCPEVADISWADAEAIPSQMTGETANSQEMVCAEVADISQSDAEAIPSQMTGEPANSQKMACAEVADTSWADAEAIPSQMAGEMSVANNQEVACPEVAGISRSDAEAIPSQIAGEMSMANNQEMACLEVAGISRSDAEAVPSQIAGEMSVANNQEVACLGVAGISRSDAEAVPSQMAAQTSVTNAKDPPGVASQGMPPLFAGRCSGVCRSHDRTPELNGHLSEIDKREWDRIYREWSTKLFRIVLRIVHNRGEVAEECVAEIFRRAMGKPLPKPAKTGPSLIRYARNVGREAARTHRTRTRILHSALQPALEVQQEAEQRQSAEVRHQNVEAWALVMDTLTARCSLRQRTCVFLHIVNGLSVSETAAILDCSERTVRAALTKARAVLRDLCPAATS